MEDIPLVSVLTTAYNREKYIAEAIESVLASTYTNFELIVVDDCSTDRTAEIAKSYEAKDKRIKVYVNEKNLGDYPNRNKAAAYATGDYLQYVDSDDKIYADGLEKVVESLERFPSVSFAIRIYDSDVTEPVVLQSDTSVRRHFFEKPFLILGPGGSVIKRTYFREIGGFPTQYGPASDMYYNLKAAAYTDTLLLPFEYIYYRRHDGQEVNNKYSYLYNNYNYLRDALTELPLELTAKELRWLQLKNKRRFVVNIAKHFLRTGSVRSTSHAVRAAGFTVNDALRGVFH